MGPCGSFGLCGLGGLWKSWCLCLWRFGRLTFRCDALWVDDFNFGTRIDFGTWIDICAADFIAGDAEIFADFGMDTFAIDSGVVFENFIDFGVFDNIWWTGDWCNVGDMLGVGDGAAGIGASVGEFVGAGVTAGVGAGVAAGDGTGSGEGAGEGAGDGAGEGGGVGEGAGEGAEDGAVDVEGEVADEDEVVDVVAVDFAGDDEGASGDGGEGEGTGEGAGEFDGKADFFAEDKDFDCLCFLCRLCFLWGLGIGMDDELFSAIIGSPGLWGFIGFLGFFGFFGFCPNPRILNDSEIGGIDGIKYIFDDALFCGRRLAASPVIPGLPGLCGAFGFVGFLGLRWWPCRLCGRDGFWCELDFTEFDWLAELVADNLAGSPGLCIFLVAFDDDDDVVDDFDAVFDVVFDWIGLIWMWSL